MTARCTRICEFLTHSVTFFIPILAPLFCLTKTKGKLVEVTKASTRWDTS